MNENQNNTKYNEDVISLRELIMPLWKRKNMIISITLIVAILVALYSMFVLSPVYKTRLNVVINMPKTYNTRYGEYELPITSNEQYIYLITSNYVLLNTAKEMGYNLEEVTLHDLYRAISISSVESKVGTIQNSFEVTVSSDNPEESLRLAKTLFNNYIIFVDVMTKERVVSYYNNYFKIELKSLESDLDRAQETLKKNEELLTQIPKIIAEGKANLEIKTQLNDTSDYVVPVDTVNPTYIKIENDIVEDKQTINDIENSMRIYKNYLKEIEVEKNLINTFYRVGETEKLESSLMSVVETNIYLPSLPVAPTQKTSPSNALNTIIGAGVGLMFSIIIALFQEYWFKELKNKN